MGVSRILRTKKPIKDRKKNKTIMTRGYKTGENTTSGNDYFALAHKARIDAENWHQEHQQ